MQFNTFEPLPTLPNLRTLDVSFNKLTSLLDPKYASTNSQFNLNFIAPNLRYLFVNNNQIQIVEALPQHIVQANFYKNQIESLNAVNFHQLKEVLDFDFGDNFIREVPENLSLCVHWIWGKFWRDY